MTSAIVLAFLYGYGVKAFEWPPATFFEAAFEQAEVVLGPPAFASQATYTEPGVRIVRPEASAGGYTLIATHSADWNWNAGLKLIDESGHRVHEWRINTREVFAGAGNPYDVEANHRNVHGSYLFPNGDVLISIEYTGVARLDACGQVLWHRLNLAHHSISRTDDGTFWLLTSTMAERPRSERFPEGFPGLDRPVNHDYLVHITGDGSVLDSISMLDVLYTNDLVRYLAKARLPVPTDLMHMNDVEPLRHDMADDYPLFEAGDLVLSMRTADLVLVVDPDTEVVKWYASDPFVQQHDPDFIGGGWIGVFDNRRDETRRGAMLGGSRVVAVQPHTDSVRVLFPSVDSDPFYTSFLGKWQLLDNGNLLLTEGRAGRVVEVDSNGGTVWEWVNELYDGEYAVEVTEGSRYSLTSDQLDSWPCAARSAVRTGETDHGS